jgi:Zn-dependent peptidase ImmA (M78 family)
VLIALNCQRPGERMRFTAAHELGHWVMALPEDMSEKDKEGCCHRFAGAFLYPQSRVLQDFGSHQRSRVFLAELLNAKRRYGVSMQVALRRLKDLSLLTDPGYMSAMIEFSRKGWRKVEPEMLACEHPRRFESLVYRGLAEDLFTPSRAAEFLRCSLDELDPKLDRLPALA